MSINKKESTLGIVGMIFSLIICIPIFPIAGLIMCIIAVSKKDTKSVCGIIGIVISGLLILFSIAIIAFAFATGNTKEVTNTTSQSVINETKYETIKNDEPIEYINATVDEMMDTLDSNALRAETQYLDKYIEVTGKLAVIDSDGKYISLHSINDQFEIIGVQCDIVNEEQKQLVINMSTGDIVTVRIKCDMIGEILGYSGDIIEIVK